MPFCHLTKFELSGFMFCHVRGQHSQVPYLLRYEMIKGRSWDQDLWEEHCLSVKDYEFIFNKRQKILAKDKDFRTQEELNNLAEWGQRLSWFEQAYRQYIDYENKYIDGLPPVECGLVLGEAGKNFVSSEICFRC
jgi:hypothetical protein